MTCAHIVDVALRKVEGVESAEVSLNRALAVVKLRPENQVSLTQLIKLIRGKGYTIKVVAVTARGVPVRQQNRWLLKVSGSNELLEAVPAVSALAAHDELVRRAGEMMTVQGSVTPPKTIKEALPLVITAVK